MAIVTDKYLEILIENNPKSLLARAYRLGRKKMSLELSQYQVSQFSNIREIK